ncbi:3-isopropylmalate dehydratase small subunit [Clostridium gasigenes]|uniref:3-isopropylmalate dehydratase small subunit n=1 Tax=Clostridium gasigenes TaxID=94869 RepID=UPI00162A785D|nr:3-isopropylmalate dehydratase small subunit [Clostridium gasigenes]MBB6625634.1 3-isopropylmalate dehydratase small subunit [Clostridium gasigenes]
MKILGNVIKYGDNVDTDVIIPARFLNTNIVEEYSKHCMEDIDKDFLKKLNRGDMIVAGKNFGCGSSREHAPVSLKAVGVSCIIAKSFARIFYRNSINIGFPIFECEQAVDAIEEGNKVRVNFKSGVIENLTNNEKYQAQQFPEFAINMIENDGLINCFKNGNF